MRTRSIRFRLTVWYAVDSRGRVGLFGGLIWLSLRHRLMAEIDRDLAGRASRFERYFASESAEAAGDELRDELEEFCQALPPASYIDLRGANGFTFPLSGRRQDAGGECSERCVGSSPSTARFSIWKLARPVAEVLHTLDLLRLLLWSLIPVVIVIACLGGAWLSGRALKPVKDITAAAPHDQHRKPVGAAARAGNRRRNRAT